MSGWFLSSCLFVLISGIRVTKEAHVARTLPSLCLALSNAGVVGFCLQNHLPKLIGVAAAVWWY